ncbi:MULTISPECIES: pyridoxamine 5'-phosphate oxidase family protein [unclassified Breznakia]|uniref:pyridoxamine 5'-phosphate oxidase family protein n=1 Tax=unclassified Breznakia TaxID=2623764 RepID=UPI002474EF72|nr:MULTISPECIES: pyridoxamine 5'-phosphate oxidase family protein [unclassified Breznakia]MDH6366413.1 putative pyridoxamine 5'-phosphate oxidase family protein [Breznakia sp. PH1-1]MDH6403506.1 putative pyridoxamine 5'-phosphate oxidase family protein [Breznakia sp. PF1-11]MDH6411215.1 putative pyridoxamine 5'-phosphate oxidase family protein [Breznakia sp. PFB1-11]MDH6413522.1 putative pyridoxamine 5'-phosphate oxidase family protein [Breznakia sp. PFB1-14]MDH6415760.1 putative pyridoxamine 
MMTYEKAIQDLNEKFGNKDNLLSLSTIALDEVNGMVRPDARIVDAYYEDEAFYVVTHEVTGKMQQVAKNPNVAICIIVENFTANGVAENLGWVCDKKNEDIIKKLRTIFAEWYYVANNEEDKGTCILRIQLKHGLWNDPHAGTRTSIDFEKKLVG